MSLAQPTTAATPAAAELRRPEILAPAGDWDCVRAAVENGADAIYFGLERFNARMRAKNFTLGDLPELMAFLHRRGVKGYVTFNTLVFADEVASAEEYLRSIIAAGADAAIVQDIGMCVAIRRISSDFPIHASTQMTVTSPAGIRFAQKLGAQLVVLARENTLGDIAQIQQAVDAMPSPVLLETFVHGALCVAYSGQCLTSESLGGRSANRGECAQACRLPYDLFSDGQRVELGDRRYLLSPRDLAGIDVLGDLVRFGVASLKIEGRLKSPEYVASITRVYRQALDAALNQPPATNPAVPPGQRYELEMSFSRGLSTGWFRGIDNQSLVHARFGTKRGVYLGDIVEVMPDRVVLRPCAALKPGDGVVFDAGNPEAKEEGGRVYGIQERGTDLILTFGGGDVNFRRIKPGQRLWKTNDPELDRRLRQSYAGDAIRFQRQICMEVHGAVGTALTVIARDAEGHIAQVSSAMPLLLAEDSGLSDDLLKTQLGRLGGTPFVLGELHSRLEGVCRLPLSELNRLRRELVAKLLEQRATPLRWTLLRAAPNKSTENHGKPASNQPAATPEIIVLVRSLAQLDATFSCPDIHTVYCELENPKHYRDAVQRFRWKWGNESGRTLWVAPPRITKPGEEWILKQVRSCEADGYLVRNYDHLEFFAQDRKRGDFPLNVANALTAQYLIDTYGLERVTASYDLNISQLDALLRSASPAWFEITLHQHMPMFHMEHCVFCAFLTKGHDYRDCGRPCEQHTVTLRDRVGAEFPLKADAGCRNTVFNNRPQTGAEFAGHLVGLGARSFRIEFMGEDAGELQRTARLYQGLLSGNVSGADVWKQLRALNQLGVTRGQLDASARVLARKQ